jgi:hypothetical protein
VPIEEISSPSPNTDEKYLNLIFRNEFQIYISSSTGIPVGRVQI